MGPTYVLAGASGFIGQVLNRALQERGLSTFCVPSFRQLSAQDLSALYPVGKKVMINCSGVTPSSFVPGKSNYERDNLFLVETIFQSMVHMNFTKVIHVSTSHLNNMTQEDEYTKSKQDGEKLVEKLSTLLDLDWKIIRIPNVWSSTTSNKSRLLDLLLRQHPDYRINEIVNTNIDLNIISEVNFVGEIMPLISSNEQDSGIKQINGWQGSPDKLIMQLRSKTQETEILLLRQIIVDLFNRV
jgi:nucleoside-diphosphate-sugar epimerase